MKATRMTREPRGSRSMLHPVGVDQLAANVCLGLGEDLRHGALLRHHAAVQNGHPVADLLNDIHLVGDDHHCDAQLLD